MFVCFLRGKERKEGWGEFFPPRASSSSTLSLFLFLPRNSPKKKKGSQRSPGKSLTLNTPSRSRFATFSIREMTWLRSKGTSGTEGSTASEIRMTASRVAERVGWSLGRGYPESSPPPPSSSSFPRSSSLSLPFSAFAAPPRPPSLRSSLAREAERAMAPPPPPPPRGALLGLPLLPRPGPSPAAALAAAAAAAAAAIDEGPGEASVREARRPSSPSLSSAAAAARRGCCAGMKGRAAAAKGPFGVASAVVVGGGGGRGGGGAGAATSTSSAHGTAASESPPAPSSPP